MYYEESVIDGVLCFRTVPNDDWTVIPQDELTIRLVKAERNYFAMQEFIDKVMDAKTEVSARLRIKAAELIEKVRS